MALAPVHADLHFDDELLAKIMQVQVLHFSLDEGLSRPFVAQLDVTVQSAGPRQLPPIEPSSVLGAQVAFTLTRLFWATRIWHGIITACSVLHGAKQGSVRLKLTVSPRLCVLAHDVGSEVYVGQTPIQIIEQLVEPILGVCRLEMRVGHDAALHAPVEHRIRFRESRLDHLHRLLAEYGLGYCLRSHADASSGAPNAEQTLIVFDHPSKLADAAPPHELQLPLTPTGSIHCESVQALTSSQSLGPRGVAISTVDATQVLVQQTTLATDLVLPGHDLGFAQAGHTHLAHSFDGRAFTGSRAKHWAQTQARALITEAHGGTGAVTDALAVHLGQILVVCAGEGGENIRRLVVAVHHSGEDAVDVDMFGDASQAALAYQNALELVPEGVAWQPTVLLPPPAPMGLHSAVVLGASPGAADPHIDSAGRVLVHFLGMRHTVPCDTQMTEGVWVRVTQSWAGAKMGTFFWPRPGMEVLVGFMGAHDEAPLILGCAYNAVNAPPYPAESGHRSGVRTLPDGNELMFNDAAGQEEVKLDAKRTLRIDAQELMNTKVGFDKAWRRVRTFTNRMLNAGGIASDPQFHAVPSEVKKLLGFSVDRIEELVKWHKTGKNPYANTSFEEKEAYVRAAREAAEEMLPNVPQPHRRNVHAALNEMGTLYSGLVDALAGPNARLVSRTSIYGRAKAMIAHNFIGDLKKSLLLDVAADLRAKVGGHFHAQANKRVQLTQGKANFELHNDGGAFAGRTLRLHAEDSVTIKQQDLTITLHGGKIEIKGAQIVLQSDDMVLEGGTIALKGTAINIHANKRISIKSPSTSIA